MAVVRDPATNAEAAAQSQEELKCAVCKKSKADVGESLMKCGQCKRMTYCGVECQKKDWPVHKRTCSAHNFILKIDLAPDLIEDPSVSRTLSCPANATFAQFHRALQIAFGWCDTHTYDFKISDPNALPPLRDLMTTEEFLSHRRIQRQAYEQTGNAVAFEGPKQNLLRIVQRLNRVEMIARTDRMWDFRRVHSQTPQIASSDIKLVKVLGTKKYGSSKIEYEYDFGDGWHHVITLAGRAAASEHFICMDGEGHGVAEDVGSAFGWEKLKQAYQTQTPGEEQKAFRTWYEKEASNKDVMGLANGRDRFWDRDEVNRKLRAPQQSFNTPPPPPQLSSNSLTIYHDSGPQYRS